MPRQSDPKAPEAVVLINDFPGLATNADPHDLPPGAALDQVNCSAARPGELRVRSGAKPVRFDT